MVECPVCLRDVQVPPDARDGDIILCPYCKLSLRIAWIDGGWTAERVVEAR